jgi:tetratricopeptide (TPR) repeat protein
VILRKLLLWCWLLVPVAALASGEEFYERLFQRGMTHFAAADYVAAYTELRNAAFGFVEMVDRFETAQVYACLAAHRIGNEANARDSLARIASAEKIQPHFRSVQIPADVRAEIVKLASTLLTEQEAKLLGEAGTRDEGLGKAGTRDEGRGKTASTDPAPMPQPVSPAPQPQKPAPQPALPQPKAPAPQPIAPMPQPVAPAPQPKAPAPQPIVPTPQPISPAPQPQKPVPQPVTPQPLVPRPSSLPPSSLPSLDQAQRAIDDGDLGRARSIYTSLLNGPALPHDAALRLAEGLYRVRDFAGAARAFARAGAIGSGEERYHYYFAVALYETGKYADAKRELAAALPYITMTPDVARYRAKIEGAIE